MAFVIDRVDLLACIAADARVRDDHAGTLSVRLASAAADVLVLRGHDEGRMRESPAGDPGPH